MRFALQGSRLNFTQIFWLFRHKITVHMRDLANTDLATKLLPLLYSINLKEEQIFSSLCSMMSLVGILRIYARSGVVKGVNETVVTRRCSIKVNQNTMYFRGYRINIGKPDSLPCRIASSMHLGCCEIIEKREKTRTKGECFFTLSESRATSEVHG